MAWFLRPLSSQDCLPRPCRAEGWETGGQAIARPGALKHRPVRSGWTVPLPELRGGGQGILLSPFSCSAISCPVPAPGMLHLLLLNHFLFTACLLHPPSSQAAASSPELPGWTDERLAARTDKAGWLLSGQGVAPWSFPSDDLINHRAR